jgi:hypothetical protein
MSDGLKAISVAQALYSLLSLPHSVEPQKCHAKRKQSHAKDCVSYDSNYR